MIIKINYGAAQPQTAIPPYTLKFRQDFIKAVDAGMDIEDFLNSHPDTPFLLRGRHSLRGLQLMALPFIAIVGIILGGVILAAWAASILSKGKSQFGIDHIQFPKDVLQFGAMLLPSAGILAVGWTNIAGTIASISSSLLALAWLFTKGETRKTMWTLYKYVTVTGVAIVAVTMIGTKPVKPGEPIQPVKPVAVKSNGTVVDDTGTVVGAVKKTGEVIDTTGTNTGAPNSLFSKLATGIGTNTGLSQHATDYSDSLANQYQQQPTQPAINWQNILVPAGVLGACGFGAYTVYQKTKKTHKKKRRSR